MRRLYETLENRRLLSVSAAVVVGDTSFVEGSYSGELRLTKADETGATSKSVTLTIDSVDSVTGQVQAAIDGADLDGSGSGQFGKAPKWARHLQLNIDTDSDAAAGTDIVVVDAHFAKNSTDQIDGFLRNDANKRIGKIKLVREASTGNGTGGNNGGTNAGQTDQQIVDAIASANQLEIQAGQLAATQSQNTEVQAYAQELVTDHQAALTQLQAVATAAGTTLTAEPPLTTEDQAVLTSLQGLTGAAFDTAFAAAMVTSHQQSITLHQSAGTQADDAGLQLYAQTQLPILQTHLQDAQALQTSLNANPGGGTGTDPGTGTDTGAPSIVGNFSGTVAFDSSSTGIGTTTGAEPGVGGGAITAQVSNAGQTLSGDLSIQGGTVVAGGMFTADAAGAVPVGGSPGPITTANGTITISVASQSPEGTVDGTVSVSGVGTYSFTGVYQGGTVSLVLTGTASNPGTGIGTDPGTPADPGAGTVTVTKSDVALSTFTDASGATIEHRGYAIPPRIA
jgi:putative membrane protein